MVVERSVPGQVVVEESSSAVGHRWGAVRSVVAALLLGELFGRLELVGRLRVLMYIRG